MQWPWSGREVAMAWPCVSHELTWSGRDVATQWPRSGHGVVIKRPRGSRESAASGHASIRIARN
eukprot:5705464-Lingulodinium_polyedra.AAC.1